ncbi:helix-turn-helix domain-containing protein [Marinobacter sp. JSM 1782161]|uniref:helix-turn-helix domain-containing protein n=1 Tax=Marinobacter sp. JSM 1782161 TaxID=2685906 RepID=UPI00140218B3|nr:helix-turn-helix transcriptional regulator [Marinobacter sp. JSM 1782161]
MASPLGEKIRARRTQLKISLEALARLTESSKSYIWELENRDKPKPSAEKLNSIAKALGVTPEYLWEAEATYPDESVEDKAFFRRYQNMEPRDKKRLRDVLDAWEKED